MNFRFQTRASRMLLTLLKSDAAVLTNTQLLHDTDSARRS